MPNSPEHLLFNEASPSAISAIHIAIDWDPTALHLRYQSTREKVNQNAVFAFLLHFS